MLEWPPKSVSQSLDYAIDWTKLLNGESIKKSDWFGPSHVTMNDGGVVENKTIIWLSGGRAGLAPTIQNIVETSTGRVLPTAEVMIRIRR